LEAECVGSKNGLQNQLQDAQHDDKRTIAVKAWFTISYGHINEISGIPEELIEILLS
jgi:hypothetical protein